MAIEEGESTLDEDFNRLLERGAAAVASGDLEPAREALEDALAIHSRDPKVLGLLGQVFYRLTRFHDAIAAWQRLVDDNPMEPGARVNLGLAHLKARQFEAAIKQLRIALDLNPEHRKAAGYLGLAWLEVGQPAQARDWFYRAGSDQMVARCDELLAAPVEPHIDQTAKVVLAEVPADQVPVAASSAEEALAPYLAPATESVAETAPEADPSPEGEQVALPEPEAEQVAEPEAVAEPEPEGVAEPEPEVVPGFEPEPELNFAPVAEFELLPGPPSAVESEPEPELNFAPVAEYELLPGPARVVESEPESEPAPGSEPVPEAGPGSESVVEALSEPARFAIEAPVARPSTEALEPARLVPPPAAPSHAEPPGMPTLAGFAASRAVQGPAEQVFVAEGATLTVNVHGELLCRLAGLAAWRGELAFAGEVKRFRGRATAKPFGEPPEQMHRLVGDGLVVLRAAGRRFTVLELGGESGYFREAVVFGFQEQVTFENGRLPSPSGGLDLVHLRGRGRLVLVTRGDPVAVEVTKASPVHVPLSSLIGWTGALTPRIAPLFAGGAEAEAVEISGQGRVLVDPGPTGRHGEGS